MPLFQALFYKLSVDPAANRQKRNKGNRKEPQAVANIPCTSAKRQLLMVKIDVLASGGKMIDRNDDITDSRSDYKCFFHP